MVLITKFHVNRIRNNQNDTGIDDDVMVMVSKGSESRSMIQHPPQGKSKNGRESPIHDMARNAMTAAAVAEERNHTLQINDICLLWMASSRSLP